MNYTILLHANLPKDMTKSMAANKVRHALKAVTFPLRVMTLRPLKEAKK